MVEEIKYTQIFSKRIKTLIVGPYPPPLGGVSVHIYRLIKLLRSNGYSIGSFDVSKKEYFKGYTYLRLLFKIILGRYGCVHLHLNDTNIFKLCFLFKKVFPKMEIFLTSHNERFLYSITKELKKERINILSRIDTLIVVGEHILEDYKLNDVKLPKRVFIKNAFLPPPLEEEKKILSTYPQSIFDFLKSHDPIILSNAFAIRFYNGTDLYGLDLCIELTSKLKNKFPNIGFVFALANDNVNQNYIIDMKLKIKNLGIQNNFYFLNDQKELWPLIKICDISIRATNTDGDAVSIREALFFKKSVIASDVIKRARGTIVFKSRNIDDLYKKCLKVLKNENIS